MYNYWEHLMLMLFATNFLLFKASFRLKDHTAYYTFALDLP